MRIGCWQKRFDNIEGLGIIRDTYSVYNIGVIEAVFSAVTSSGWLFSTARIFYLIRGILCR